MLASPRVESTSRLGLLRRSPSFGYVFLATAGSSFGTYIATIALVVSIYDLTDSSVWVAALLITEFLPIVVIGLLLGPLVDRLSRRRLMIGSDLVRFGVFAALPFVESPTAIPEGTRFRLDPGLDLSSLRVSPLVREMARAVQRYGLVIRDRGGAVAFYAEDPGRLRSNPYRGAGGIFGGSSPSELMRQFPWEHLQALKTDLRTER